MAEENKIKDKLISFGKLSDDDFSPAVVAVYISAVGKAGISVGSYLNHLDNIKLKVKKRYNELIAAGACDDAGVRLASLKYVISEEYGYEGDEKDYDNLENFDLIRVIDRRKGAAISLGIIYIYLGQELGWDIKGLNFPAHFLLRIEKNGERIIFNPFDISRKLEAYDLRGLIKKYMGEDAELSSVYYDVISNRDVITRILNIIKFRLIKLEDYKEALKYAEYMLMIAPSDYRPLFDAAVLYAKTEQAGKAVPLLERYIREVPDCSDRQDAVILLRSLTIVDI